MNEAHTHTQKEPSLTLSTRASPRTSAAGMAFRRSCAVPGVWGPPAVAGKHAREVKEGTEPRMHAVEEDTEPMEPTPAKMHRVSAEHRRMNELREHLNVPDIWWEENAMLLRSILSAIPAEKNLDSVLGVLLPRNHVFFTDAGVQRRARQLFASLPVLPDAELDYQVEPEEWKDQPEGLLTEIQMRARLRATQLEAQMWISLLRRDEQKLATLQGAARRRARESQFMPTLRRVSELDRETKYLAGELMRRFHRHTAGHWSTIDEIWRLYLLMAVDVRGYPGPREALLAQQHTRRCIDDLLPLLEQGVEKMELRAHYLLTQRLPATDRERVRSAAADATDAATQARERVQQMPDGTPANVPTQPWDPRQEIMEVMAVILGWIIALEHAEHTVAELLPRAPTERPDELWLKTRQLQELVRVVVRRLNRDDNLQTAYDNAIARSHELVAALKQARGATEEQALNLLEDRPYVDSVRQSLLQLLSQWPSDLRPVPTGQDVLRFVVGSGPGECKDVLPPLAELPRNATEKPNEAFSALSHVVAALSYWTTKQQEAQRLLDHLAATNDGLPPPPVQPDEVTIDDRCDDSRRRLAAVLEWERSLQFQIHRLGDYLNRAKPDDGNVPFMRRSLANLQEEEIAASDMRREEERVDQILQQTRRALRYGRGGVRFAL